MFYFSALILISKTFSLYQLVNNCVKYHEQCGFIICEESTIGCTATHTKISHYFIQKNLFSLQFNFPLAFVLLLGLYKKRVYLLHCSYQFQSIFFSLKVSYWGESKRKQFLCSWGFLSVNAYMACGPQLQRMQYILRLI